MRAGLFIAFLFLFLATTAQQKIPMDILPSGHFVVQAQVNGKAGKFIFDTGAGITVLTKKFASQAGGFQKHDSYLTGFRATGERLDLELFTADSLVIGHLVQKNPTVSIIDADFAGIDGIISLMPFLHQPFTLDLANRFLIIETPADFDTRKAAGVSIPLFLRKDRRLTVDVFVDVVLNNQKKLQFMLDSGAGAKSYWIHSRYLAACGVDTTDTVNVKKTIRQSEFDKSHQTVFYHAKVPVLSVAGQPGIDVRNFKAVFTRDLIYDGKVSINWLGDALTFDLENKQLIINR